MKLIFFGSGKIAVSSLKMLVEKGYGILSVITAPDRRRGRHLNYSPTPIKEFALSKNLNIFQPNDPSADDSLEYIRRLNPDIFVVFSYGKILSKELLQIAKAAALNIHASLLPKYRGAAPINWALINGEIKTGITIIRMNEKLDEGDIILKKEIDIDYFDNVVTIEEKLAKLTPQALLETLSIIKNKDVYFIKQNNNEASYAPKLKRDDGRIDWNKSAEEIRNKIRGCFSWPGAFSFYNKDSVKIWEAEVVRLEDYMESASPGSIISSEKNGIVVATKDSPLLIKELQFSSGRRLGAWQLVQGHKINKGGKFT